MFFPARRSRTRPARLSCARWVEMRDWPMFRTSWISATVSSACSSNRSRRKRVASASNRKDLMIEGMAKPNISKHHDLFINIC